MKGGKSQERIGEGENGRVEEGELTRIPPTLFSSQTKSSVAIEHVLEKNCILTEVLLIKTDFKRTFAMKKNLTLLILFLCLQGEEKIEFAKDISGPLKALDYAVKQPYFPRHLKSFFVAFISK